MAARRQSRVETAGGREVSDAERRRQRAFEVGWAASLISGRAQTDRSGCEQWLSNHGDVTQVLSGRATKVFFRQNRASRNGVPAGVFICNAGYAAAFLVMASNCGSLTRVAPRVAEQRGAWPSGKHEHD
jgi:hypothetical protein